MRSTTWCVALVTLGFVASLPAPAHAQQFNSDNYLSKPVGVATLILTYGDRNSIFMNTFSLIPKWEFTAAVYVYNWDNDPRTDDGYSTSLYAKYMIHENHAKSGGMAVKFGTGQDPGYLLQNGLKDAFKTYWTNAPVTLPFLDNKLSWDIMPGASVTFDYGTDQRTEPSFTYSTRLAWYPRSPTWAIVGEVFGQEGGIVSIPEYKTGLRWEPSPHVNVALTYGQEFHGTSGAGFEAGLMLFTPPFFSIGGQGAKH